MSEPNNTDNLASDLKLIWLVLALLSFNSVSQCSSMERLDDKLGTCISHIIGVEAGEP